MAVFTPEFPGRGMIRSQTVCNDCFQMNTLVLEKFAEQLQSGCLVPEGSSCQNAAPVNMTSPTIQKEVQADRCDLSKDRTQLERIAPRQLVVRYRDEISPKRRQRRRDHCLQCLPPSSDLQPAARGTVTFSRSHWHPTQRPSRKPTIFEAC